MLQESDQVAQACKQNYTGYIEFKQANDTASAHIHSQVSSKHKKALLEK